MHRVSSSVGLFLARKQHSMFLTCYGKSPGCLTHSRLPPVLVLLACLHQMGLYLSKITAKETSQPVRMFSNGPSLQNTGEAVEFRRCEKTTRCFFLRCRSERLKLPNRCVSKCHRYRGWTSVFVEQCSLITLP